MATTDRRTCPKCGIEKDRYLDFYFGSAYCKSCQKQYGKDYYAAHKEEKREKRAADKAAHYAKAAERELEQAAAVAQAAEPRTQTPEEVDAILEKSFQEEAEWKAANEKWREDTFGNKETAPIVETE